MTQPDTYCCPACDAKAEAASPAALDWAQRAIDRMLRAADTETRYWIEGIVREERARLTDLEDRHD